MQHMCFASQQKLFPQFHFALEKRQGTVKYYSVVNSWCQCFQRVANGRYDGSHYLPDKDWQIC